MTERWPLIAGRREGDAHVLPVRIYYEDTDAGGVVYHANYLRFCERGRSDFLRLLDIHHHGLDDAGFVVRRMVCDFLMPAKLDDLVEVETRLLSFAGARLELDQRVTRNGGLLFSAAVTVALVDSRGRPKRLPGNIVSALKSPSESGS